MVGRQGRGTADLMNSARRNRYTILEKRQLYLLSAGFDTLSVVGSEVIHDREEQVAEIWNASFQTRFGPRFL